MPEAAEMRNLLPRPAPSSATYIESPAPAADFCTLAGLHTIARTFCYIDIPCELLLRRRWRVARRHSGTASFVTDADAECDALQCTRKSSCIIMHRFCSFAFELVFAFVCVYAAFLRRRGVRLGALLKLDTRCCMPSLFDSHGATFCFCACAVDCVDDHFF